MKTPIRPQETIDPPRSTWPVIATMLIAIFLFRGLLHLSILPPFEGWDEYQHLAYIVYLDERGALPVLGESVVPESLRPLLIAYPHSVHDTAQTGRWGTLSYPDYWKQRQPASTALPLPPLLLYEAQHPPLYYWLMRPVWLRLAAGDPLAALYALRLVNVLFGAVALTIFACLLRRAIVPVLLRTIVLALVALHPLFLQNTARIANDALAIAFETAAVCALVLAVEGNYRARSLLAAVFVGLGIWTKQSGLVLIPVLFSGLAVIGWLRAETPRKIAATISTSLLTLALIVAPLWLFTFRHYGSILATQEAIALNRRGATTSDLVSSALTLDWGRLFNFLVPGTVWRGGWSFVPINADLGFCCAWVLRLLWCVGGVGAMIYLTRPWRRRESFTLFARTHALPFAAAAICGAVVVFTLAGMVHHALLSRMLQGETTTNFWYFMMALPCLFLVLLQGAHVIHFRLPLIFGSVLAALFLGLELHGLFFQLAPFYAGTTDPGLMWTRLGRIHPAVPSPSQRGLYLALIGIALGGLLIFIEMARRTNAQKLAVMTDAPR